MFWSLVLGYSLTPFQPSNAITLSSCTHTLSVLKYSWYPVAVAIVGADSISSPTAPIVSNLSSASSFILNCIYDDIVSSSVIPFVYTLFWLLTS